MSSRGLTALSALAVVAMLLATWFLAAERATSIIAVILGLGGAGLIYRWPALGPPAVVIACLLVPYGLGTGTQTEISAGVLVLTFLLGLSLVQLVARGDSRVRLDAPVVPLILLVAAATLSFLAGLQPWISFAVTAPVRAQAGGLAVFALSAGAFLLTMYRTPSLRWLQLTTGVFLLFGTIVVVGRFAGISAINATLASGASGSIFWVWIGPLAVGQALWNRRLGWAWRLLMAGVAATALLGIFITGRDWLSGWFPMLIATGAVLLIGQPKLIVPLGMMGVLVVALFTPFLVESVTGGDNLYSLETRLEAWIVLLRLFMISPVIGLGPANYYWYTPLFPILGYYVSFNSHNNYVDLLLETGLLGLICFGWFAAACGFVGWQLRSRVPDGFARGYVLGALGGLVGTLVSMMLGDWFIPFVYNIGYAGMRSSLIGWVFLGGLIALSRIYRPVESRAGRGDPRHSSRRRRPDSASPTDDVTPDGPTDDPGRHGRHRRAPVRRLRVATNNARSGI